MTHVPLLQVDKLKVVFEQGASASVVVDEVSFSLDAGECLALVGQSGSGKSVTAHAILRLLPDKGCLIHGDISLEGRTLPSQGDQGILSLRGRRISMIFQEPMTALNPLHRVGRQIEEMLQAHGRPCNAAIVDGLLQDVELTPPSLYSSKYPHELSGGQRQRVMIAMAIANSPDLLIADEPTTALDVTVQKQILDLLNGLRKRRNMAMLLITHDLGIVRHYADRVLVMNAGKIVEQGCVETVFASPDNDYTRSLINAEPDTYAPEPPKDGSSVLEVSRLGVAFVVRSGLLKRPARTINAVSDVSFMLAKGETLGIVGESGSGKTTLAQAILKLVPSTGHLAIEGVPYGNFNRKMMLPVRRSMQIVFQDPFASLSPRMTVGDIVAEGLGVHFDLDRDSIRTRVLESLSSVGLPGECAERYPHEFSGGQRQRIAIARALVLKPRLLILDEPTSALDRAVQKQVVELLKTIQRDTGISYLFISHDLKLVRAMSHRIMVMKNGCVVEHGDAAEVFERPRHPYTRQLLAAIL